MFMIACAPRRRCTIKAKEMPEPTKRDQDSRESQLGQSLRGRTDPVALVRLLDEWMQDDEEEQRATFQTLRRALDEDRPAGYKLFP
jgi:hypothetical protein